MAKHILKSRSCPQWLREIWHSLSAEEKKNYSIMARRLEKGCDPLTGDIMETVGKISMIGGCCVDETGKQVTLDDRSNWVYCRSEI